MDDHAQPDRGRARVSIAVGTVGRKTQGRAGGQAGFPAAPGEERFTFEDRNEFPAAGPMRFGGQSPPASISMQGLPKRRFSAKPNRGSCAVLALSLVFGAVSSLF